MDKAADRLATKNGKRRGRQKKDEETTLTPTWAQSGVGLHKTGSWNLLKEGYIRQWMM